MKSRSKKIAGRKPKAKPGRPAFNPTKAQLDRVAILAAGRVSHDDIALELGIDAKTLRLRCGEALDIGSIVKNNNVVVAQYEAAIKHNVAAQREWRMRTDIPITDPNGLAPKLGKKEAAKMDARKPDQTTAIGELMARRASAVH